MSTISPSETKTLIYGLIEKIISYEDQIKSYQNNNAYKTAKEDLIKNKENIVLLNQFIKNEITISNEKISQLNKEINDSKTKLDLLKQPECSYSKKDYEQNLVKQKCFEKTLWIYNNEYTTLKENLLMLKEEKKTIENDLVYIMSLKETYEETLNSFAKFIFKNLIISYDNMNSISVSTSLSSFTNINYEIESYELENISISKISNFIVENILSKYITSLSQITKNNIKIIMDDVFDKYRKGYIKINDLLRNLALNITNSDSKLISFVDAAKFEIGIRYVIKLFFFDDSIANKLSFINDEYKKRKLDLKSRLLSLKGKIDLIESKKKEEESNGKEIQEHIDSVNRYKSEIELMKGKIKDKEREIQAVISERERNIESYTKEIKDLEEINKILELKYDSQKIEKEVGEIKSKIESLFQEIKKIIKENDTKNDDILNMFINEINMTLPPSRNVNQSNIIAQEIHTTSSHNNSNLFDTTSEQESNLSLISKFNKTTIQSTKPISNLSTIAVTSGNTLPPLRLNLNTETNNLRTIEPSKPSVNELVSRLYPLYEEAECYIQLIDGNLSQKDFNPLIDSDIIPEEKKFTKGSIRLSKDYQTILIRQQGKEELNVNINLIEKTIVNGAMKTIINVIQMYRKKYNGDIKKLLSDTEYIEKEIKMSKDSLLKCVYPKYYYFSILLTVNKKINILFLNYKSFKVWLNGMACIIKNKKSLLFI